MVKLRERKTAIGLRKKGLSYGEILERVPVTKSSLSLWLRNIPLKKNQRRRLIEKGDRGRILGGEARRNKRIKETREIKDRAMKDIGRLSKRELWLIGVALYWAEGSKEKAKGSLVRLGNSDPKMIKLFLKWLQEVCQINKTDIIFRIYLHETSRKRTEEVKNYWSKKTAFPKSEFEKITWKKNKIKTNRTNIGNNYYGLLDVTVKMSVNFNRKIQGWIEGICFDEQCGVV